MAKHAMLRSASVTERDYPSAARRRGEQGRVVFQYVVDPAGRPRDCVVQESSGSALLDEASCNIVLRRFRFAPARSAAGEAVAQRWVQTIDWQLPRSINLALPMPATD
ncbi:MAG: energy transducer TonB [Allosphingosinicella sp.]|uniref:energy transducer TonB n=1 Tax=Allosphingosinicella sp. TaxID=2823234 RepID=UPI003959D256